ncbi:MAG: hypothetical protein ACLQOO_12435 [Terriglobia bacterium]
MNSRRVFAVSLLVIVLAVAVSARPADKPSTTVKGYVIDSACTFTKGLKKPLSPECAVACAKAGSPLVIQTAGGTVYLPIDDAQPAKGQNERLMPYAGQMVSVTGKVYEKGGAHAIVIEKIEAASK